MGEKWQIIDSWMRAYGNRVTRVAAGVIGDAEAAQDIAQETFIRAFHGLDTFREGASPGTYLTRIANNLAIDYLRVQKRRNLRETDMRITVGGEDLTLLDTIAAPDTDSRPEQVFEAEEKAAEVRKALHELPLKYRQAAVLFYLAEMNVRDVSKTIGVAEGTVKSRLSRARKLLARQLEGRL